MKKYQALLLFLLVAFSLQAVEPLSMLQSAVVDSALQKICMTRSDLSFHFYSDKPDTFRLSLVNRLFNNSLSAFTVCDSIAEKHWLLKGNLKEQIRYNASLLEVNFPTPSITANSLTSPTKTTNNQIINLIQSYLSPINVAIYNSLGNFSDSDRVYLQKYIDGSDTLHIDPLLDDLRKTRLQVLHEDKVKLRYFHIAAKINRTAQYQSAWLTADLIEKLLPLIQNADSVSQKEHLNIDTPWGNIVINPQSDELINAIFAISYNGNQTWSMPSKKPFFVMIDLNGNDSYQGEQFSLGSGYMGVNALIDLHGNDTYQGKDYSIACGYLGTGILMDVEGDDHYQGESNTEAAGILGIGLLVDQGGNDVYECSLNGQAFASVWGVGTLIDHAGNDFYLVKQKHLDSMRYDDHFESLSQGFSIGERPYFSGGIGILADQSGNDTYVADIYGQGSSYWYAIGGLIDQNGNDHYTSYQYSQGAGIHLAFGCLIDFGGNDNYQSNGVSQGCGHDFGFGGLFDYKGDDNYVCQGLSQGGGNADAISFFMDVNGQDGYIAKTANTMGYSDLRRGYGYIGLFFDLNGDDFYGSPSGKNNSQWIQSTYGIGSDCSDTKLNEVAPTRIYGAVPIDVPLGKDVETLFLQSAAMEQKYAPLFEPARKRLIEMGDTTVVFLMQQLDTELPREQLTLTEVIPKIGHKALPYLYKELQSGKPEHIGFSLYLIGKTEDSTAFQSIVPYAQKGKYRYAAIQALAYLKDKRAIPYLISALDDSISAVRREAAIGLQSLSSIDALPALIKTLSDPYQEVRYAAQSAIVKINPLPSDFILQHFDNESDRVQRLLLLCLKQSTEPNVLQFIQMKEKAFQ